MSGDATALIIVLLAGAALLALALCLVVAWRRRSRRQARLDDAFERARNVRRRGSGLQGTPYSLYGESSWSSDTRRDR